jgi:hypothetical protein
VNVDEVNALIPQLDAILGRLTELKREIAARASDIERLGYNPASVRSRELPPEIQMRRDLLDATLAAFEAQIERIGALGGLLEDLELGIVDFHHDLEGRPVLLCWQFGEHEVTHFHPAEGGFRARRRLPDANTTQLPH